MTQAALMYARKLGRDVYRPQYRGVVPVPWRQYVQGKARILRGPAWEAMLGHNVESLAAALVYLAHTRFSLTHRYASNRVNQPGASCVLSRMLPRAMDKRRVHQELCKLVGVFSRVDMNRFVNIFQVTAQCLNPSPPARVE